MMHDRPTFRLCVGQTHTRRRHVVNAWRKIQDVAAEEGFRGSGFKVLRFRVQRRRWLEKRLV